MSKPRIVIVGAGFAGYHAARTPVPARPRRRPRSSLVNPTDYFLYLPLLPEVAAGVLEPRRVSVSLAGTLPGVRLVLGEADPVDLRRPAGRATPTRGRPRRAAATTGWSSPSGSVNKLLPIPGVTEHAHGFRGCPRRSTCATTSTRQIELADAADDPRGARGARCTFVVVGAGYTGTEVAAHGQLFTDALAAPAAPAATARGRAGCCSTSRRRVLPELDQRLSDTAERVLRQARRRRAHRQLGHRGDAPTGCGSATASTCHPVADLVRRRTARPAGGRPRTAHGAGAGWSSTSS